MDLNQEILKINERNKKVETDKAWETSATRRIIVIGMTFLAAFLFLKVSGEKDVKIIFVSALIPSIAYFLSTSTLRYARRYWEKWKQ